MDADDIEQLQKLIRVTKRRLHILEQQAALHGRTCPPEILIEIKDVQNQLEQYKQQLDATASQHAQPSPIPTPESPPLPNEFEALRRLRVFLCHSSKDKADVRELHQRLQESGVDPWLDEEELVGGQDWQREIYKAVRASDVVLVCLSRNSVTATGFVLREIEDALTVAEQQPEGTIFIIPLRLEECEVPERLGRWHWINLFADSGFDRLLLALKRRANELGLSVTPSSKTTPPKMPLLGQQTLLQAHSIQAQPRTSQAEATSTTRAASPSNRLKTVKQALLTALRNIVSPMPVSFRYGVILAVALAIVLIIALIPLIDLVLQTSNTNSAPTVAVTAATVGVTPIQSGPTATLYSAQNTALVSPKPTVTSQITPDVTGIPPTPTVTSQVAPDVTVTQTEATIVSNEQTPTLARALTPIPVQPQVGIIFVPEGANIRVRSKPTLNAEIIARVPDGTGVEITGFTDAPNGKRWYRLNIPSINLQNVWMAAQIEVEETSFNTVRIQDSASLDEQLRIPFLNVAPAPVPPQTGTIAVPEGVNMRLRSKPALDAATLATVAAGTAILVTGFADAPDGMRWYRLDIPTLNLQNVWVVAQLDIEGTKYDTVQFQDGASLNEQLRIPYESAGGSLASLGLG